MKKYNLSLNGKVVFYNLSIREVEIILTHSNYGYEWGCPYPDEEISLCLGYGKGINFLITEDFTVAYQFDSTSNDEGENYHELITFPNGKEVSTFGSDWNGYSPNARFSPIQQRSAGSLGYLAIPTE